jgi:hypothetical protein
MQLIHKLVEVLCAPESRMQRQAASPVRRGAAGKVVVRLTRWPPTLRDGFCEVHVNTLEGFWSLLRSWLRPHRGIPQESLPLYLGFFEFVHNVRARGKRLLAALIGQLLAPPCNPS